ncbi:MAG TPA: dihydropteroate synthase, partial [Bacteroidia bacterium]|nr:dihydropteroate synthase [Bacteroidia bacterium]
SGVLDIIIDPGFGFGKTTGHNFEILRKLSLFKMLDCPVMAGISRKSMINKILKTSPAKALNGTTVLNTMALLNGANILRVHDVKQAKEAVELFKYYSKENLE